MPLDVQYVKLQRTIVLIAKETIEFLNLFLIAYARKVIMMMELIKTVFYVHMNVKIAKVQAKTALNVREITEQD